MVELIERSSILVIENETELRNSICECLNTKGYTAVSCGDMTIGLRKIQFQKFNCILLDLNIIGGSGEELIKNIRQPKQRNYKTPIIIISGHIDKNVIQNIGKNVQAMITKPFKKDELLSKIESVVNK